MLRSIAMTLVLYIYIYSTYLKCLGRSGKPAIEGWDRYEIGRIRVRIDLKKLLTWIGKNHQPSKSF